MPDLNEIADTLETLAGHLRDAGADRSDSDGDGKWSRTFERARSNPYRQGREDGPTEKQLNFLGDLGYQGYMPETKSEASDLIKRCLAARGSKSDRLRLRP